MVDVKVLRDKVSGEIEALKVSLSQLSDRMPDEGDAGSVLEQQISIQNQLKLKKARYQQLSNAVAKQLKGTYGICMDCGIDIPIARLERIPDAPCCVDCQEIREHKRKVA